MPVAIGAIANLGDHSVEVLDTPEQTGDRYRVRIVARPGGGPGIDGDGPHIHPALTEVYECVSGTMSVRVDGQDRIVRPGQALLVPPGTVHGFVNIADTDLVVDADIVFGPEGWRAKADLIEFALVYAGLTDTHSGSVPLLQMAALLGAYRDALQQPGLSGIVLRLLAPIARWRGYTVPASSQ